jgi:hypothetical protein
MSDGVKDVPVVLGCCAAAEGVLPRESLEHHDAKSPDVILCNTGQGGGKSMSDKLLNQALHAKMWQVYPALS